MQMFILINYLCISIHHKKLNTPVLECYHLQNIKLCENAYKY